MVDLPLRPRSRFRSILRLSVAFAIGRSFLLFDADPTGLARDRGRRDNFGDSAKTDYDNASNVNEKRRTNCQIIYVLGVEGSMHHGFTPILKSLAERQSDSRTGTPYDVVYKNKLLNSAMFKPSCHHEGSEDAGPCIGGGDMPMDDPNSVQALLRKICPDPYDLQSRHVIIEDNSFPSGLKIRSKWSHMSAEEIANSTTAANHPTNLNNFYDSFGPYVDVRFLVLHRPYLETIASHPGFDGGPIRHSVVLSGFIILLSRFLTSHMYSPSQDGNAPLWMIVCTNRLVSKSFQSEEELLKSRASLLRDLAYFLGWPVSTCPECFDNWKESKKVLSPRERFGDEATDELLVHAKKLESIWPPRRPEDFWPQHQCGLL